MVAGSRLERLAHQQGRAIDSLQNGLQSVRRQEWARSADEQCTAASRMDGMSQMLSRGVNQAAAVDLDALPLQERSGLSLQTCGRLGRVSYDDDSQVPISGWEQSCGRDEHASCLWRPVIDRDQGRTEGMTLLQEQDSPRRLGHHCTRCGPET